MPAYIAKLERIAKGFGLTVDQMLQQIAAGILVVRVAGNEAEALEATLETEEQRIHELTRIYMAGGQVDIEAVRAENPTIAESVEVFIEGFERGKRSRTEPY